MGSELATSGARGVSIARVEPRSLPEVYDMAERLSRARGFVPDAYVGQPAAIAACILTGIELGLGPMQAMREIYVVKGRPSLSAVLMLSLARREGIRTRWIETTSERAEIGVTVPGQAEQRMAFTRADAERAKLWGQQGPWSQYPAVMLRARCTSHAMRAFCPEVLGGSVYESDSGELTDGVPVGDVIEVQAVETRAPERAGPPRKLSDCADAAALRAWCEAYGPAAVAAKKAEPVLHRGEKLGVPAADVRAWLGLEEPPAPAYDPGEQDAPPPDDA